MTGKRISVVGGYATNSQASRAVMSFLEDGFVRSRITLMQPDMRSLHNVIHIKDTKAPEGTSVGATGGAALGGALGFMTGSGVFALPGLAAFVAAGPIIAALAGMGVGGVLGGFIGAVVGLRTPEYEAKPAAGELRDSSKLLSIHCESLDEVTRAKAVFGDTGARDISTAYDSLLDIRASS